MKNSLLKSRPKMKKKVLITRSILNDGLKLLEAHGFEIQINPFDRPFSYEELNQNAKKADAIISMLDDQIDREFLLQNSHLKVISNYAVGFNNIDIKTASELNIRIGNTPGVLTEATAEVAIGLMIAATRNFLSANKAANEGKWKGWHPTAHLGNGLRGKNLGIIGMGRIGQRVAEIAHYGFGMNIQYYSNTEKQTAFKSSKCSLEEMLSQSDIISVHLPLNSSTRHFIGSKELKLMKKSAVLINTARGEIIDQEALILALKEKTIFAAGLDVTTPEPLPCESDLFKLENAIILPHIGSASFEARRAMSIIAAQNVIAGIENLELVGWVNR
jgi:glyoxylate reductase